MCFREGLMKGARGWEKRVSNIKKKIGFGFVLFGFLEERFEF